MTDIAIKDGQYVGMKSNRREEHFGLNIKNTSGAISDNEKIDYELNDLIGPFGFYQIIVMVFSSLREGLCSIDCMSPSLALPLDDTYRCVINETQNQSYLDMQYETEYDPRCYYMDTVNSTVVACTQWTFQDKYKNTMLAEWNLVCDRQYLTHMVHSSFFTGLFLGNALWGPLADKYGRWKIVSIGHILYLVSGAAALFAPDVHWFMVLRFLAGFTAVAYYILPTLQVEIIATKYRSFSNSLNHIGWGLGVILVPFFGHFIHEWRYLIAVPPIAHAILLPYLLIVPESIRWMILNGQMDKARKEIKRGAKLNRWNIPELDKKIDKFFASKKLSQTDNLESRGSFSKLFTNSTLFKGLITLGMVFFTVMYIYYSRTLHFAPDEASMFANFIIAGTGEWICLLVSATSMYYMPRKTCLALFLGIASISLIVEGFAHKLLDYAWPTFDYTIDAFIKLFVLCSIMVTLLIMLETFPTELRQRGVTIICILGNIGMVIAPFASDFQQVIGHVSYTFSLAFLTLLLAISIKYSLQETGKSEILDTVRS